MDCLLEHIIEDEPSLPEDEGDLSSIVALSNGVITESMVKEEETVMKEVKEEPAQKDRDVLCDITKEERYQLLLKLLSRSKFYTQYIQKRITDTNADTTAYKKPQNKKGAKSAKQENSKSTRSSGFKPVARAILSEECRDSPKRLKLDAGANGDVLEQPALVSGGQLRSYQIEGFHWLRVLYENGVNGILGDEMGLGKTIQCIALLAHLIEMNVPGPFLMCAPLSTLPNWMAEFQKFTPKIPVMLYHGDKQERTALWRKSKTLQKVGDYSAYPVIVTSYDIVIRDHQALGSFEWKYIIVDEGHRIKNMNCILIRHLRKMSSVNRLLLTGTPLQNNLSELWSLLNFILPEIFDDLNVFESWFDVSSLSEEGGDERIVALEQENRIISMLHEILSPFLLRRIKTDVEMFLPPKKELLIYAPLTARQQVLYRAILDKTIEMLLKKPDAPQEIITCRRKPILQNKPAYKLPEMNSIVNVSVRNNLMHLRKCCNHPYLLEYPLEPGTGDYRIDQELIQASGKLLVFQALVEKLKENGHKILVFSQMTKMLDILIDFCYLKKYHFSRLDGSMSLPDRQEAISQFNDDPEVFLFLLSTRAGGLGLNLTAADTVIIYDSDWNPQCDLQAMDRCHRIGQTKPVIVYRLITANTIDQRIVERAAAKRKLEKMIIQQGKFNKVCKEPANNSSSINPAQLLELLKDTDHDGVIHSDDPGVQVFTNDEMRTLLDRDFSHKQPSSRKTSRIKVLTNN